MLSLFRSLFPRKTAAAVDLPPPAPDGVMSVVGDVHGCARQLRDLLPDLPGQIVLVGDLVDRGEESAAVLDLLMARPDIVCLMGNHEQMLLRFLDDPEKAGAAWLRFGGLQTLASFGVGGDVTASGLPRLRDGLALAMGDVRIDWLRARPLYHRSGTVTVTHAGGDPARPIDAQSRSLVWGHPDCGQIQRRDGMWLVHGHVIVEEPDVRWGVVRVDTGAYAGGPLTAAILGDGDIRFHSRS